MGNRCLCGLCVIGHKTSASPSDSLSRQIWEHDSPSCKITLCLTLDLLLCVSQEQNVSGRWLTVHFGGSWVSKTSHRACIEWSAVHTHACCMLTSHITHSPQIAFFHIVNREDSTTLILGIFDVFQSARWLNRSPFLLSPWPIKNNEFVYCKLHTTRFFMPSATLNVYALQSSINRSSNFPKRIQGALCTPWGGLMFTVTF